MLARIPQPRNRRNSGPKCLCANRGNVVVTLWARISAPSMGLILLLVFSFIAGSGCTSGEVEPRQETRFLMDTTVTVSIFDQIPAEDAEQALTAVFAEMERIESLLSVHEPHSDVARINREAGKMVAVAPETFQVVTTALEFSRFSGGAFDITIGPLRDYWKEVEEQHRELPEPAEVASLQELVDYRQVELDTELPGVRLVQEDMALDLGGVAKGYAVDRGAEVLRKHGLESAMVDAGGDIAVVGYRPGGEDYRIGVQHPRQEGAVMAVLEISDTMVMTSGDYQRYIELEGQRFHHIIDPNTGYPARSGVISATVVGDRALEVDMMATALVVLGWERGQELLLEQDHLQGLLLGEDQDRWVSPGLEDAVRWH